MGHAMTSPHAHPPAPGSKTSLVMPPVTKSTPVPCTRCATPTRHRCKACGVIECALCLSPRDLCGACR